MKQMSVIVLSLLGLLNFSVQSGGDWYNDGKGLTWLLYYSDNAELQDITKKANGVRGKLPPYEIPYIHLAFAQRDSMHDLAYKLGQQLISLAAKGNSLKISLLTAGSASGAMSYLASYLWGKTAKPAEDSSGLHKSGYYTIAALIPLLLPTIGLIAVRTNAQDYIDKPWTRKYVMALLATLAAYPAGIVGSYFGHKHA